MAGSLASEDGRCLKTRGSRWRCPMPAEPNRSFCRAHRIGILKKTSSSLQENPGQVLDHQASKPDNFGSCKKRSRRRERAVPDPAASTKKHKRKKTNNPGVSTKKHKKKNKTDIKEESEPQEESDSERTWGLLIPALRRELMKTLEEKKEEEEFKILELPNGTMIVPMPRQNTGSSSTVCAVEPQPVPVIKKLPARPWGLKGLQSFFKRRDRQNMRMKTATSVPENRSSSIRCTDYKFSQLQQLFDLFNREELTELLIEGKETGKCLADVRVETTECSQDLQYECSLCGGLIISLYRVCSRCFSKCCLRCSQRIRLKDLFKETGTFEQKDDYFPETRCGRCGDFVVTMNLILPFGFLESLKGGSNRK